MSWNLWMMKRTSILKILSVLFFLSLIYILFIIPKEVLLSFDTEIQLGDEEAVIQILDILDEYNASSTFFVMGTFAEKNPAIIKRMIAEGHEVACHTQNHKSLWKLDREETSQEIMRCKKSIEKITEKQVIGFRAPWRIITSNAFDILKEEGFMYDASIFEPIPLKPDGLNEIRTSSKGIIPLDDYIVLRTLHIPKSVYFFMLRNSFDRRISVSFHPHIIIEDKEDFKKLIGYYSQKNVNFLTHEQSLMD